MTSLNERQIASLNPNWSNIESTYLMKIFLNQEYGQVVEEEKEQEDLKVFPALRILCFRLNYQLPFFAFTFGFGINIRVIG